VSGFAVPFAAGLAGAGGALSGTAPLDDARAGRDVRGSVPGAASASAGCVGTTARSTVRPAGGAGTAGGADSRGGGGGVGTRPAATRWRYASSASRISTSASSAAICPRRTMNCTTSRAVSTTKPDSPDAAWIRSRIAPVIRLPASWLICCARAASSAAASRGSPRDALARRGAGRGRRGRLGGWGRRRLRRDAHFRARLSLHHDSLLRQRGLAPRDVISGRTRGAHR
jgi:hypothetical protein